MRWPPIRFCLAVPFREWPSARKHPAKYLEWSNADADYCPWQEGLFVGHPYRIGDGHAIVPEAPGRGGEINPDWLAQSRHRVSVKE